jgi:hypothetical protein
MGSLEEYIRIELIQKYKMNALHGQFIKSFITNRTRSSDIREFK